MTILSPDDVVALHKKLIAATGGLAGLRDRGLLESAVMGCYQTFDKQDLYPTIEEKAARMAFALCKNHPFIDGNKRIAVTSMLVILRMNGISLSFSQRELADLGLGIAAGSVGYEGIVAWINAHAPRNLLRD
ncbi:MAG: type II toxin-antitoxin system death-on-curing family toxin [Treponema sp.]|nr:type II toxin-antitoxin system death-on-curing family toxin [Treponema sp.]